jgi:hypothetical protein
MDRAGPGPADLPGPARRTAVQHLPDAAKRRRSGRRQRADLRRGRRVHDQSRGRTRRGYFAHASPTVVGSAGRAPARLHLMLSGIRPLVRREHQAVVLRPRVLGRRADPALVRSRRRPHPAPALGPDHGGHPGRSRATQGRRSLHGYAGLPASLAAVEPRVREIYASGWRPPVPDGPTRDELAELVAAAAARRVSA